MAKKLEKKVRKVKTPKAEATQYGECQAKEVGHPGCQCGREGCGDKVTG